MKSFGTPIRTNSDWVLLKTDPELSNYYVWFLKKFGIIVRPTGFPHITIVASKYEKYEGEVPNEPVEFEVLDLFTEDGYYWLEIDCPWIHQFREYVGLNPNLKFAPHLTLGRFDLSWGRQKVKRQR